MLFSNFSWYIVLIAILLRQVLAPFESINSGVLTKSKILMLTVLWSHLGCGSPLHEMLVSDP